MPARAVQVNPSGASLAWDASPDPTAIGYNLYYGPATGTYTNRINVGGSKTALVTGLVPGSTTFFAATAYDNAGQESLPSNEVVYTSPGILQVGLGADQQLHISFPASAGHWYDVQASTNLVGWDTITSVLSQTNGWLNVIDTNWTGSIDRFYRLVLK
ncbi:MAG: fibronectin type III domain-containing protein [Limisphaerales bacterium]